MKRFILAMCASLLAAAVASPSLAADLPRPSYKAPLYVAPFSWTGFYVGINGGYGWGKADLSSPDTTSTFTTGTSHGWLLGGTMGYNYQTGNWVWGIEGDIDYAWLKGHATNDVGGNCNGGGGCTIKDSWLGTARGRVGYAWDRWLPYFTGGLAFGNTEISSPAGTSNRDTNIGWTVGAGVEYAFQGAWSVKLEYLYIDLGNGSCDASVCGTVVDYKIKTNLVRAGLNYRF